MHEKLIPNVLGVVGPQAFTSCAYGIIYGVMSFGSTLPMAEIPFGRGSLGRGKKRKAIHACAPA